MVVTCLIKSHKTGTVKEAHVRQNASGAAFEIVNETLHIRESSVNEICSSRLHAMGISAKSQTPHSCSSGYLEYRALLPNANPCKYLSTN